jgi:hypothetical protein
MMSSNTAVTGLCVSTEQYGVSWRDEALRFRLSNAFQPRSRASACAVDTQRKRSERKNQSVVHASDVRICSYRDSPDTGTIETIRLRDSPDKTVWE